MENTTTNICVNVSYYWEALFIDWRIIAASSYLVPLSNTCYMKHIHPDYPLCPFLSWFSQPQVGMIPTSSPFSLQPSGRRYMFLLSNFKPKGKENPFRTTAYLPQKALKNKIYGEERKSTLGRLPTLASQPVIHQKEEKVKVSDSAVTLSWKALKQLPRVSFYRIQITVGPSLLLSHLSPNMRYVVS